MTVARQVTVDQRERAIFRHLNAEPLHDDGATAKEVWDAVTNALGDSVTVQAYYKLLDRMAAAGRLEVIDADVRRYRVAPYLHSGNAVGLDDLYAMLDELQPTQAIAQLIDARHYFEEHRADTLAKAARSLAEEDPRSLVSAFVHQRVDALGHDIDLWAEADLRDRGLEQRIFIQARELDRFAYRYLGLTRSALDVRMPRGTIAASVEIDARQLDEEIALRVFGDRFLMRMNPDDWSPLEDWNRHTVSGSDGSTYASILQLESAQSFTDDVGSQVVTFNNAVASVPRPPVWAGEYGSPYHSVPMTRSAIDDASNRGMVLAPFMFRYLEPSEYEHMAKCATDVIQWRVDRDVMRGDGRSMGEGRPLAKPIVHFRDGTITPQEREWGHYSRLNEYGEMVREGIRLSRQILELIKLRGDRSPVFGGSAKTTQTQFFSTLVNWYISHGSRARFGTPIHAEWDTTRAAHIADNEAMSFLLSTLPSSRIEWWVTFAVARPFHSLTEYYNRYERPEPRFWIDHFGGRRAQEVTELKNGSRPDVTWLASMPDVENDDFIWLATNADYVNFYIGHTASDPPPVLPRYEFLDSLRGTDPTVLAARVQRTVGLMVLALQKSGLSDDRDHNFLSSKTLTRIVPFVIYDAHEKCKAIGRELEKELRSIIVQNLQRLRGVSPARAADVRLRPVAIRRFLERYRDAMRPDELDRER